LSEKIKLAHLITRLIIGGAQENTLSTVLYFMDHPDYEVTLITGPGLGPEGSLEDEAKCKNVPITVLPFLRRNINPFYDIIAFFQMISLFRKNKYDIIHTHSSKAGILGRLAAYFAQCPVIIHTIHGLPFHPYEKKWKNVLYVFLEKICAKVSSKIVTVSDTMRDKALIAGVGRKEQYITIYSGMNITAFANAPLKREHIRKQLGIKDNELVVGKIARLFHLKGHDFVVDCAKAITDKFPQTKFLFVGDGILRKELTDSIANYGLSDHFIFTGLVAPDTIPDYIAVMDILVHTSLREGLARALPQALAAGIPVVSLDIDSAHEVVINDRTGYLVQPDDKKAFIAAIINLLSDATLRKQLGSNGTKLVVPLFDTKAMCRKLNTLYQELLTCGR
jgi:glycosyltransferase involved in cell wall biosynthesis